MILNKRTIRNLIICDLIIISIPIFLNFVLSMPSPIPSKYIIGNSSDWLSFWGVYIGSIGTFLMALIAVASLKQNDKLSSQNERLILQNEAQLSEIKRQWDEQNTPVLSCGLSVHDGLLVVEIVNSSNIHANNIRCNIANHSQRIKDDFSKLNATLDNILMEIPPHFVKRIKIHSIEPFAGADYGNDYISVSLSYENKNQQFDLYLQEITVMTWQYSQKVLIDKIDGIKNELKSLKM